jgi:predicted ATPase
MDASKVFVEEAKLDLAYDTPSFPPRGEPIRDTFSYHAMTEDELALFLQQVKPEARRLISSSSGQPNYFGTFVPTKEYPSPSSYLLTLSHFLPARLVRKFQERERIEEDIEHDLGFMFAFNRAPGAHLRQVVPSTPLSDRLQTAIHQLCQYYGISSPFEGSSLLDLEAWSVVLREKDYETGSRTVWDLVKLVKQDLLSQRTDEHVELLTPISESYNPQITRLMHAVDYITAFFSRNVRYLGPLRADPGTVQQQFAPTGNLDEVGAKGEYSAIVYHYNQHVHLEHYHPVRREIERATLQEALDTWAQYLGVAHQVRTDMAGVIGMTWKVFLKPGVPPRSLSQVGVGTSQILPLLVMGLLSPKQSLLVIEQPELHLHPRIQSHLGDFFLGLAKCQKQCLIETHSENLVNQLRYHIVRSGGQDNSGCAIYFAQQDEQGTTTFDPIRISARGNIVNWPDGFFDETLLQQEQITEEYLRQEAERSEHEQHPG